MADDLGQKLVAAGWDQGALVALPGGLVHELSWDGSGWVARADELSSTEGFAVVSQLCDIAAGESVEPCVEVMRCFWTEDAALLKIATKRNSFRRFLLETDGKRGLIVDATSRTRIAKSSLANQKPRGGLADARTRAQFGAWLARRFDRPAIADSVVAAVQRPIVRALEKLKSTDAKWRALDAVEEIRFATLSGSPTPVALLMMREEGALSVEEEATLHGWLDRVLSEGGGVQLTEVVFRDDRTVSLRDYLATTLLPLDHMTP